MGIKTFKPTTKARRTMSVSTFEEITKSAPEKALAMGRAGQERVRQLFGLDRTVTNYLALYQRLGAGASLTGLSPGQS